VPVFIGDANSDAYVVLQPTSAALVLCPDCICSTWRQVTLMSLPGMQFVMPFMTVDEYQRRFPVVETQFDRKCDGSDSSDMR